MPGPIGLSGEPGLRGPPGNDGLRGYTGPKGLQIYWQLRFIRGPTQSSSIVYKGIKFSDNQGKSTKEN